MHTYHFRITVKWKLVIQALCVLGSCWKGWDQGGVGVGASRCSCTLPPCHPFFDDHVTFCCHKPWPDSQQLSEFSENSENMLVLGLNCTSISLCYQMALRYKPRESPGNSQQSSTVYSIKHEGMCDSLLTPCTTLTHWFRAYSPCKTWLHCSNLRRSCHWSLWMWVTAWW